MFTNLDRIVEQIEQIPWSDKYLWRDKDDFVKFVKNFESREAELEAELDRSDREYGLLDDRFDSLQEEYDDLDRECDRQYLKCEELEEENANLLKTLNESETS